MTTDPQTTAWLDQEDARLAQVIRARRWAVQYVWQGDGPDEPAFGYTIGLFGLGHPELVLVGWASTPPTACCSGRPRRSPPGVTWCPAS